MFKMLALIAVVAAVNAQVEMASSNNDLNVARRQEVTMFNLSSAVAALEAQMGQLAGNGSPLAIGVRAIADGMQERTTDIVASQATLTAQVSTLTEQMSSIQTNVNTQLQLAAAADADRAAAAQAEASQLAADMEATMDATLANITRGVDESIANITNVTAQAIGEMQATVATVQAGLAGKADAIKKMWSGGCSEYPGGGWRWYCYNRELYNTAAGHFVKHSHTEFRALRSNIFIKMIMFTITHGSGWNHMQFQLNGQSIYYTYSHTAGCWWKDMHGNMIFRVATGNKWRVRMHGACSHAFHPGGRLTDHHSRVTVTSEGPSQ